MGGCASRPKEFDSADAPAPVDAPETSVAVQEGGEVEKEAPLVDLSEPAAVEEGEKKEEEKAETKKAEGETSAPSS
ncbi:hypothetical protein MLD38_002980 [Melastoma candidum]|uniref:Uncharacterized protein n=1 Tax=Melastoma candidum TaxID=119954 RepID=A0ACB9S1D1_9MYRT|nr:hypothetical protein MLD38_002980 [Melastoma candidum]